MKYASVLILSFCLIAISCKTKEVVSPDDYEGDKLILTHGGGFAGTYKTFCLLDNGQLFKSSKQFEATNPTKNLDKEITDQIFSNYKMLGLDVAENEAYGNLNYSITMISKDGSKHKLIWDKGQEGTEKFQLFYRNIMNQIRLTNTGDDDPSKS